MTEPRNPAPSILVVDDEPDLLTLYELTLLREGYEVDTAETVGDAWELLSRRSYRLVITDLRLPDDSGMTLVHRLETGHRPEKVIVITAYGSAENAVEALKAGAFDYLTKPVDLRQFRSVVAAAMGRVPPAPPPVLPSDRPQSRAAPALLRAAGPLDRLVGDSEAMCRVRSMVEKVARSMAPVLVHGESGTGKELVARAVHEVSARASQPFIPVNCGAIPENLLESEFFGYRKGAFTGANEDRAGFFQAANGGTLFLDEIGDLPLAMQSKLLRVIQERAVRPVGAVAELPLNVRIISATHKDLAAEVEAGRFRQDLFYRLNVIGIEVPALRERRGDLAAISSAVLARIARDAGVFPPPALSPQALSRLAAHRFPGNVRELENLLHRAVAMSNSPDIQADDLGLLGVPDEAAETAELTAAAPPTRHADWLPIRGAEAPAVAKPASPGTAPEAQALPGDLAAHLDEVERGILVRALQQHGFNRTAAGARMGLTLRQMRYRMARLGITEDEGAGGDEPGGP